MKTRAKQKRLQARIKAWENHQSDRFRQQKTEGGAKCPGSNTSDFAAWRRGRILHLGK